MPKRMLLRRQLISASLARRALSGVAANPKPLLQEPMPSRSKERAPATDELSKALADDHDYDYGRESTLIKRPFGYSFGGGPGAVRDIVKQRAAEEMLAGGLLEMSHREAGPVHNLLTSTQELLRDLLSVPRDYEILFIQGGAHAQFAAVPLNFGNHPRAVACVMGAWSSKGAVEQKKFATVVDFHPESLATQESIVRPFLETMEISHADYGYICTNETMQGIQLRQDHLFSGAKVPVVADSTSDLFSRRMDISKFGAVFASGGKNLGPAGFAVVIVKRDIIYGKKASHQLPSILSWKEHADSKPIQNIYNTPPLVSIGLARLVLEDLAKRGGVEWAEKRNKTLAAAIYDAIDSSNGFYVNKNNKDVRSNVSVVFGIPEDRALEAKFIKLAEASGLLQLMNHPSVGGMRASIYNAVPVPAVELLIKFMREFQRQNN